MSRRRAVAWKGRWHFVVCAIDSDKNANLLIERIYPEPQHSNTVIPKLEAFWRICILPDILRRWYTRRCEMNTSLPSDNGICFCRGQQNDHVISCSNADCSYRKFHITCFSFSEVPTVKTWYCRHCSRLTKVKHARNSTNGKQPSLVIQAAMLIQGNRN